MNRITLYETREALRRQLTALDAIAPCCTNCLHFSSGSACDLFHAAPPPEWVRGEVECEKWEHDGVPF
jgi:hypothetical protein